MPTTKPVESLSPERQHEVFVNSQVNVTMPSDYGEFVTPTSESTVETGAWLDVRTPNTIIRHVVFVSNDEETGKDKILKEGIQIEANQGVVVMITRINQFGQPELAVLNERRPILNKTHGKVSSAYISIPQGHFDGKKDKRIYRDTAVREAQEEAGLNIDPDRIIILGDSLHVNVSNSTQTYYVVVAELLADFEKDTQNLDTDEVIRDQVAWLTPRELRIARRYIKDVRTREAIGAYLLDYLDSDVHKKRMEAHWIKVGKVGRLKADIRHTLKEVVYMGFSQEYGIKNMARKVSHKIKKTTKLIPSLRNRNHGPNE